MSELIVQDLSVVRDDVLLVDGVSFALKPGELVALIGPNGAGKTLTLRAALGLEPTSNGTTKLDGDLTEELSPHKRALKVTYLPQRRPLAWPMRVRDLVALGRFAHGARLGRLKETDADAVTRALEACSVAHLSTRKANTLSGGELARVHAARAFVAKAPLLIADEPIAALDPRHQFQMMRLFKSYVADGGGALLVLHDISLAAKYADRLIWMKDGQLVADGTPANTLTEERLADVYGVTASIRGNAVSLEDLV